MERTDVPTRDQNDDELPEFPYDERNPDSSLPDEDAQEPAASGLDDLRHAKAKLDDNGPTLGDVAKSIAKSADLNTDAIQSLVSAVEQLGASLPGTTAGESTTLATPSPETPTGETQAETPLLDLSRVTAGLDRIYSAIVDGKSSASATPQASAAPEPFISQNVVPGKKTGTDKVHALLTEGEYVMRPEAVKMHGIEALDELNKAKGTPPEKHWLGAVVGAARVAGPLLARGAMAAARVAGPAIARGAASVGGGVAAAGSALGGAAMSVGSSAAGFAASHVGRGASAAWMQRASNVAVGGQAGGDKEGGGFYSSYKEATRSAQAPEEANHIGGSVANAAISATLTAGPLAGAVATVVAGFKAVGESANAASKQLASYSAEISTANAEAEQAQITGDMDRAAFVGEDVGRFTRNTSDISQSNQNLEAVFMKAGLAVLNPILELMKPFIQKLNEFIAWCVANALEGGAIAMDMVGMIIDALPFGEFPDFCLKTAQDLRAAKEAIEKLAADKDKDLEGLDINSFMNQFLHGHGMGDDQDQGKFGDVRNVGPKKKPKRHDEWFPALPMG